MRLTKEQIEIANDDAKYYRDRHRDDEHARGDKVPDMDGCATCRALWSTKEALAAYQRVEALLAYLETTECDFTGEADAVRENVISAFRRALYGEG